MAGRPCEQRSARVPQAHDARHDPDQQLLKAGRRDARVRPRRPLPEDRQMTQH